MKRLSARPIVTVLIGAALVTACASFEGVQPNSRLLDAAPLALKDSLAGISTTASGWPIGDWWKTYGDPQLNVLIAEAQAGSPTLASARARIEQANALTSAADARRQAQVDGGASLDRQRYTEHGIFPPPIAGATLTTGQLSLNFSYDFDFWGRQRAALEAALSRALAATIEGEAAKLTLVTAVALSYVELERQYAMLDVAEASLRQSQRIRDLTASRVDAGLEAKLELHQSASAVFTARIDVESARARIALLKHELAALVGQGPDRGLTIARPRLRLGLAAMLPVRLPTELLGRRPDIVAQRLRVESAGADIAAARAGFYPNINLAALIGFQSVGLDQLLNPGSRVIDAATALGLPIFDGGRLRANLTARDADYDLAVEQYNGTLVDALRVVADQVSGWHAIDLQIIEQGQAQAESKEAYRLAFLRYQGDLSSYLSVLRLESQMLVQERIAADLRARRLTASIGLARALGGGFHDDILAARAPH